MTAPIELDLDGLEAAAKAAGAVTWKQGQLLPTEITSKFTATQVAEAKRVESLNVFSHFSFMDEGRGRERIGEFTQVNYARFAAHANPAVVLELVRRLRAAEGAARFFYAKYLMDGVLEDEQCGEMERQELAVPDIAARAVPPEHEFSVSDDELLQELEEERCEACGRSFGIPF